jgi:hypothetical protein
MLYKNFFNLLVKAAHIALDKGPFNMLRRAWRYLRRYGLKNAAAPADYNRLYQIWIEKNEPKPQDFPRLQSEAESLPYKPLISIVMGLQYRRGLAPGRHRIRAAAALS